MSHTIEQIDAEEKLRDFAKAISAITKDEVTHITVKGGDFNKFASLLKSVSEGGVKYGGGTNGVYTTHKDNIWYSIDGITVTINPE